MVAVGQDRARGGRALAALVFLALIVKMMVPAGFMPGTSPSVPIVLCPEQTPTMPAMTMHHAGTQAPAKQPHGTDHPCAFAGVATASMIAPLDGPGLAPIAVVAHAFAAAPAFVPAAGHGLAAPPPPSHAPPVLRA